MKTLLFEARTGPASTNVIAGCVNRPLDACWLGGIDKNIRLFLDSGDSVHFRTSPTDDLVSILLKLTPRISNHLDAIG